jgi:hypothetical protein
MERAVTGWWRRNAVALAAVAVLLPATVAVVAVQEGSGAGGASHEIVVPLGESIEYSEATVGPADAEFVDDPLAPRGTRVVRVTVEVVPDPAEPIACKKPLLREVSGLQREWEESSYELGRGYEELTFCSSDEIAPYSLVLDYVVPDDADGPFTVDVDSVAGWPVLARLQVEP